MELLGWKGLIGSVAPMIGTALGGPLGGLATSAALSALGIEPKGSPEDNERLLEAKLENATPADMLAIKQAEYNFKKDMKSLGITQAQLEVKDRDSARRREQKVGGFANPILASVTVLGFFIVVAAVFSGVTANMSVEQVAMASGALGYASAKADQVISYYFGSSSGQDHTLSGKAK